MIEKKRMIKEKAVFLIYLAVFLVFASGFSKEVSAQSNSQTNAQSNSQSTGNICCVDQNQGCFPNTPLNTCSSIPDSQTFNDASCLTVQGCNFGCCIIGGTYRYNSEIECKNFADTVFGENNYDFADVFRGTNREYECYDLSLQEQKGCCVDNIACSYAKKNECSGEFNINERCSEVDECSQICTPREHKDCYEGSAYWFDSCGNPDELIEQCNFDDGRLCAKDDKETVDNKDDEAFCRSIDCPNTKLYPQWNYTGGYKKNGESWCIYEGPTGNFLDKPGTRHYVFGCVNGEEELIEECTDFRKGICVQTKVEDLSYGTCFRNNVYDSVITSNISTVPEGFKFWENEEENSEQCSKGSTSCTVVYVRKNIFRGTWDCKVNCHCLEPGFADGANDYCKQFGDCGFNYNVLNVEGSSGYRQTQNPFPISEAYKEKLKQYGIYGGINELGKSIGRFIEGDFNKYKTVGGKLWWFSKTFWAAGGIGEEATKGVGITAGAAVIAAVIFLGTGAGFGAFWAILSFAVDITSLVVLFFIGGVIFVLSTSGVYKTSKKRIVDFQCKPWQAPLGGEDCDKCNEDQLGCTEYKCRSLGTTCKLVDIGTENEGCVNWEPKLGGDECDKCNELGENCTEERCKFLGTTCELLNKDTDNPKCVDSFLQDNLPPRIMPMDFSQTKYTITEDGDGFGYKINEKVEPLERFTFGIKTHEYAICNFDLTPSVKYDDMQNEFGESYFRQEHNKTLVLEGDKNYNFYIKCADRHGFKTNKDYTIRFETSKGPDREPPVILRTNIENNALISNQPNNASLEFEINEPGYCRYDTKNEIFDEMAYLAACDDEFSLTSAEYSCIAGLVDLKEGPNRFYIKCRDLENNTYRRDSYEFNLIRGKALKIEVEDESPSGLIYTKDVTLSVSTSDGSENGRAICRFSNENLPYERMIDFTQTNSNRHLQSQTNLRRGNYEYYVKCKDSVGNIAEEKIKFRIVLDRAGGFGGSELVNVYKDSSSIYVIMDAATDCEYDNKAFVFGNGREMAGEKSTVHTAPLEFNEYYIECKDEDGKSIDGIRINV